MAGLGLLGLAVALVPLPSLTSARVAAVTRQLLEIPVGSLAQAQACRRLMPARAVGAGVEGNDFCYLQARAPQVALLGDSMNLSLFPGLADHGDINVLLASASEAAPFTTHHHDAAPALLEADQSGAGLRDRQPDHPRGGALRQWRSAAERGLGAHHHRPRRCHPASQRAVLERPCAARWRGWWRRASR
jgi:hypothetical protein